MVNTLFVSVALAFVTGFVYAAVGRRVGSRTLTGEVRLANQMFALWWWAFALITVLSGLVTLAAAVGYTNVRLHVVYMVLVIFVLCMALWALAYYLLYLFTGRTSLFAPLGVYYTAYFVFLAYMIWAAHPIGVSVGPWATQMQYEHEFVRGGSTLGLLVLLVAPQIVGGLAYFSMFFRVDTRSQKYRIAMVAGSILVWFGSSIVANAAGGAGTPAWNIISRLIGLVAALVIYMAFMPPRWIQRRYGIEPVSLVLPTTTPLGESRGRLAEAGPARVAPARVDANVFRPREFRVPPHPSGEP